MKSFDELRTQASQINTGATDYPTDSVLKLLSDTKATCESYPNFKYDRAPDNVLLNHDIFDLRVCRDLCVSGLNSAENKVALDARFKSVNAFLLTYSTTTI